MSGNQGSMPTFSVERPVKKRKQDASGRLHAFYQPHQGPARTQGHHAQQGVSTPGSQGPMLPNGAALPNGRPYQHTDLRYQEFQLHHRESLPSDAIQQAAFANPHAESHTGNHLNQLPGVNVPSSTFPHPEAASNTGTSRANNDNNSASDTSRLSEQGQDPHLVSELRRLFKTDDKQFLIKKKTRFRKVWTDEALIHYIYVFEKCWKAKKYDTSSYNCMTTDIISQWALLTSKSDYIMIDDDGTTYGMATRDDTPGNKDDEDGRDSVSQAVLSMAMDKHKASEARKLLERSSIFIEEFLTTGVHFLQDGSIPIMAHQYTKSDENASLCNEFCNTNVRVLWPWYELMKKRNNGVSKSNMKAKRARTVVVSDANDTDDISKAVNPNLVVKRKQELVPTHTSGATTASPIFEILMDEVQDSSKALVRSFIDHFYNTGAFSIRTAAALKVRIANGGKRLTDMKNYIQEIICSNNQVERLLISYNFLLEFCSEGAILITEEDWLNNVEGKFDVIKLPNGTIQFGHPRDSRESHTVGGINSVSGKDIAEEEEEEAMGDI